MTRGPLTRTCLAFVLYWGASLDSSARVTASPPSLLIVCDEAIEEELRQAERDVRARQTDSFLPAPSVLPTLQGEELHIVHNRRDFAGVPTLRLELDADALAKAEYRHVSNVSSSLLGSRTLGLFEVSTHLVSVEQFETAQGWLRLNWCLFEGDSNRVVVKGTLNVPVGIKRKPGTPTRIMAREMLKNARGSAVLLLDQEVRATLGAKLVRHVVTDAANGIARVRLENPCSGPLEGVLRLHTGPTMTSSKIHLDPKEKRLVEVPFVDDAVTVQKADLQYLGKGRPQVSWIDLRFGSGVERAYLTRLNILEGHSADVSAIVFHSDGETLASGDRAGNVTEWNVQTCRMKRRWNADPSPIRAIDYALQQRTLLTASESGHISIWDSPTGRLNSRMSNAVIPSQSEGSAVFTADGKRIVVGSGSKTQIWNILSGIREFESSLGGWRSGSVSRSTNRFIVGGTVRELTTGATQRVLSGASSETATALSPDGARCATVRTLYSDRSGSMSEAEVRNVEGNTVINRIPFRQQRGSGWLRPADDIALSDNGRILTVVYPETRDRGAVRFVLVWDCGRDKCLARLGPFPPPQPARSASGDVRPITCLAQTGNGKRLAVAYGNCVLVWTLEP